MTKPRTLAAVDLNLITVLGALLEERNLTRAGERLYLSQPAMSGALARLRKIFDDELLIRQGRTYSLSPLAEELLPDVQTALAQAERTLSPPVTFDASTSHRVFTLAIWDYALTVLLEPLLGVLAERAPDTSLDCEPLLSELAPFETALMRNDVLIGPERLQIGGEHEPIFGDRYVCVISPRGRSDRRTELTLDDLAALPYAAVTATDDLLPPPEQALEDAGISPSLAVSVPGAVSLPFVINTTDMFCFMPERLAVRCAAEMNLRIVATPLELPGLIVSVHWHPMNAEEAGVRWLVDTLLSLGLMK